MRRLLDKKLLSDVASIAALAVLPAWDPLNIDKLTALAPTLPYPIVIKPRMHVNSARTNPGTGVGKGAMVSKAAIAIVGAGPYGLSCYCQSMKMRPTVKC